MRGGRGVTWRKRGRRERGRGRYRGRKKEKVSNTEQRWKEKRNEIEEKVEKDERWIYKMGNEKV